jgi:hypothetical protein
MKKKQAFTARQFAMAMGVSYRTVMGWLAAEIVPGAKKIETPVGSYWLIPELALRMERPTMGPKAEKR